MKAFVFFWFLFLFSNPKLWAQEMNTSQVVGSVFMGITVSQPIGSYKARYPQARSMGANFGFTLRPQAGYAPVELGLNTGYLLDGISKHQVGTGSNAYTLKTAHNIIPLHAFIRLKPRRVAALNPYLDGLAGITIFNSRTKIKEDVITAFQDKDAIVVNKFNNTVFNYGLAVGLAFRGSAGKSIFADLRFVYLESPLTNYVKRGNITVSSYGDAFYNISHSETSMFLLQLNLLGVIRNTD